MRIGGAKHGNEMILKVQIKHLAALAQCSFGGKR
jgi:hypothetical protein